MAIATVPAARGVEFSSRGGGSWKSKGKVPPGRLHTATFSRRPQVAGRAGFLGSPHQGTNPIREDATLRASQRPEAPPPDTTTRGIGSSGDTRVRLAARSEPHPAPEAFCSALSRSRRLPPLSTGPAFQHVSTA